PVEMQTAIALWGTPNCGWPQRVLPALSRCSLIGSHNTWSRFCRSYHRLLSARSAVQLADKEGAAAGCLCALEFLCLPHSLGLSRYVCSTLSVVPRLLRLFLL